MAAGETGVLCLADYELLLYSLVTWNSGLGEDKFDVGSV
jgi:hypothetical protein